MYRKSIKRDAIEAPFEEMLRAMQPSRNLVDITTSMLKHAWGMRLDQQVDQKAYIARQLKATQKQIDGLVDKMIDSQSATVTKAIESRVEKLETDKLLLAEKQSQSSKPKCSFEEIFELSMVISGKPL
ncbi:hypothetical protein [Paracoccus fistulariae]|uniref:Uncharacterized protein n=1 Tax=Paracoccus fistulariae TaxID=658446 RepID=A0ABY7SRE6_9RHOB|nr:hypothetical protein [Paracoccus fistulariae]MDB6180481.1 hypothetical protein [Paracoccus fistulariae]WCR08557.1 hypothetical protein JHX87_07060 [Paracoccus fistulariae]